MKRRVAIGCVIGCLVAGCGGGTKHPSGATPTPPPTTPPSQDAPSSVASLTQGVRSAVQTNARLSSYVLWHNVIPSWAERSTRGPALRGLRSSAASRHARGLRIRSVSQHVAILSIKLDPSYLVATARVRESGRIVPYRKGHRLGRSTALNEVARIELHRVAKTTRFVVWKVTPAQ
jgi:hypothetical protein